MDAVKYLLKLFRNKLTSYTVRLYHSYAYQVTSAFDHNTNNRLTKNKLHSDPIN